MPSLKIRGMKSLHFRLSSTIHHRRRRMRLLDSIIDSMNISRENSGRLWRIGKPGFATVHGVAKSRTQLSDWTANPLCCRGNRNIAAKREILLLSKNDLLRQGKPARHWKLKTLICLDGIQFIEWEPMCKSCYTGEGLVKNSHCQHVWSCCVLTSSVGLYVCDHRYSAPSRESRTLPSPPGGSGLETCVLLVFGGEHPVLLSTRGRCSPCLLIPLLECSVLLCCPPWAQLTEHCAYRLHGTRHK